MMSVFGPTPISLDGSRTAATGLRCATRRIASRLQARARILSATLREVAAGHVLARPQVAREHRPLATLHQAPAYRHGAMFTASHAAARKHPVQVVR